MLKFSSEAVESAREDRDSIPEDGIEAAFDVRPLLCPHSQSLPPPISFPFSVPPGPPIRLIVLRRKVGDRSLLRFYRTMHFFVAIYLHNIVREQYRCNLNVKFVQCIPTDMYSCRWRIRCRTWQSRPRNFQPSRGGLFLLIVGGSSFCRQVVGEIEDIVKTGCWVGDCFIYTNNVNRLNYYVGGEIVTIAHLDRSASDPSTALPTMQRSADEFTSRQNVDSSLIYIDFATSLNS